MATSTQYLMSDADLEKQADFIKRIVLNGLVMDGQMDKELAEQWCENHTVLKRDRSFFRTIGDKWINTTTDDTTAHYDDTTAHYIVVKKVGGSDD